MKTGDKVRTLPSILGYRGAQECHIGLIGKIKSFDGTEVTLSCDYNYKGIKNVLLVLAREQDIELLETVKNDSRWVIQTKNGEFRTIKNFDDWESFENTVFMNEGYVWVLDCDEKPLLVRSTEIIYAYAGAMQGLI